MAFYLSKNLVFVYNMKFLNFSLDKLVRNLSDEDFKYLLGEFGSKNLELLNKKVLILMSIWTALKNLKNKNYQL